MLDGHHGSLCYSAAGLEFGVNVSYILNKMSLNRNTHDTGCLLIR